NDTMYDVAKALKVVAATTGIDLLLDLDAGLPPTHFDSRQMYNAIYNLVDNAIPETAAGGSVMLRTRTIPDDGEHVLIEIEDTGNGMPAHVSERLFTGAAISTKPGGTGLGTRIVSGVVRRHGGQLKVHSQEGEGTTISIRLPT